MVNQIKIINIGTSHILYDTNLIAEPSLQLFDVDYHTKQGNQQNNSVSQLDAGAATEAGIGRARVVYFSLNNVKLVLKHYYRGGAVATLLKDHYLGFNVEKSRAFREWRLLKKMRELNLPVPDAAAAHVKKGLFFYQADLITRKIDNASTLSDCLTSTALSTEQWELIGLCIKQFHDHDIYHADLNARNIMLDDKGIVYLIDFDNSYIRSGSESWKQKNLARLKRSLLKFKKNEVVFHFTEKNWSCLIKGYR